MYFLIPYACEDILILRNNYKIILNSTLMITSVMLISIFFLCMVRKNGANTNFIEKRS